MKERSETIQLHTALGEITGIADERCRKFLGIPYAHAARFEYAVPVERFDAAFDACAPGPACPQNRAVHEHLENPTRRFYKREFRDGMDFRYEEDCLNLNIFTPKAPKKCPVVIFIHGGGFDSGINSESPYDGSALAERGILTVFINYRVGVLGYFTHEALQKRFGRDGNFGLDDQRTAIRWVKKHIPDFGGDPENITLVGQSAGAISIQYLCLNPDNHGLFQRAVMMSGGGQFPKFSLPRPAAETHEYWLQFMALAECGSFDEFQKADLSKLFDAVEKIKTLRKDSVYHTMPVIDGYLLPGPVDQMIRHPLPIDYMIGYTNNDMYAPIMAKIGNRFGKDNGAYIYYFDLDAPGDDNRAFHSSDLRYMFETLKTSWRPYSASDYEVSETMAAYLANFARGGNPNGPTLPLWKPAKKGLLTDVLHISKKAIRMGHVNYPKLLRNMLTKGDPKGCPDSTSFRST